MRPELGESSPRELAVLRVQLDAEIATSAFGGGQTSAARAGKGVGHDVAEKLSSSGRKMLTAFSVG